MSYRTILAILFNAIVLAICICPSGDEENPPRVEPAVPSANSVTAVDAIILLSGGDEVESRIFLCRDWVSPRDADFGTAPHELPLVGPAMACVGETVGLPAQPPSDHSLSELMEELFHGPAFLVQRRQDLVELGL